MFYHLHRSSTLRILLLASSFLFLISCAGPATSPAPALTPTASKGGGAGGDDERPITMLGGSMILTWDDTDDGLDSTGAYAYSSSAPVNAYRLVLRDRSVMPPLVSDLRVKRQYMQPVNIVVDYAGTPELSFSSDMLGKNLVLKTVSGGDLHTFIRHSKFVMEHPDNEKHVSKITFYNVVAQGTVPNPPCVPSGTTITCTIDTTHQIRSRLVVRPCIGATCPAAAN